MPEHPCAGKRLPPAPRLGVLPHHPQESAPPRLPGALSWLGRCPADLAPLLDSDSPGRGPCQGAAWASSGRGGQGRVFWLPMPVAHVDVALPCLLLWLGSRCPGCTVAGGGGARPAPPWPPPHPPSRPARGKSSRQCQGDAPLSPTINHSPRAPALSERHRRSEESAARPASAVNLLPRDRRPGPFITRCNYSPTP